MKLLHIADLHLGKRVNEFSLIEDQQHILDLFLQVVADEKPQGVLIAGDVYDKSQPSAEAVELLDEFLTKLTGLGRPVFMISGNHDSPERLGFGSRILQKSRLHIAGVFNGALQMAGLEDKHGAVNIFMLPFIKPAMVKPFFDEPVDTCDEAVRAVMATAKINPGERNILLAHQFVVNGALQPERSDSENLSVGGLDSVDVSAFDAFDYVALGHLHGPQKVGRESVLYAGSPLKYSFSEVHHQKSATLLEFGRKGELSSCRIPLTPRRDLRKIKGPLAELLRSGREEKEGVEDYIHATLTDEGEIYDAIGQLRQVYRNLMALEFENSRTGETAVSGQNMAGGDDFAGKSPLELFADFYRLQNSNELTPEQTRVLGRIFEEAGGVLI